MIVTVIDVINISFVEFFLVNNVIDIITTNEEGREQVTNDSEVVVNNTLGNHLTVRETEASFQEPILLTSFLDRTRPLKLILSQGWFVGFYDWWQREV